MNITFCYYNSINVITFRLPQSDNTLRGLESIFKFQETNLKKGAKQASHVRRRHLGHVVGDGDGRQPGSVASDQTAEEQHPSVECDGKEQVAESQKECYDEHGKFATKFSYQGSSS